MKTPNQPMTKPPIWPQSSPMHWIELIENCMKTLRNLTHEPDQMEMAGMSLENLYYQFREKLEIEDSFFHLYGRVNMSSAFSEAHVKADNLSFETTYWRRAKESSKPNSDAYKYAKIELNHAFDAAWKSFLRLKYEVLTQCQNPDPQVHWLFTKPSSMH